MSKIILLVLLLSFTFSNARGQIDKNLLKSALVEKLIRYTIWPNKTQNEVKVIGIFGNSDFTDVFVHFISSTKYEGHYQIVNAKNYSDVTKADVLMFDGNNKEELERILDKCEGLPVLLISEKELCCSERMHYTIYTRIYDSGNQTEQLHFEINTADLSKSGLKPDIRLLNVGKIVKR